MNAIHALSQLSYSPNETQKLAPEARGVNFFSLFSGKINY